MGLLAMPRQRGRTNGGSFCQNRPTNRYFLGKKQQRIFPIHLQRCNSHVSAALAFCVFKLLFLCLNHSLTPFYPSSRDLFLFLFFLFSVSLLQLPSLYFHCFQLIWHHFLFPAPVCSRLVVL